MSLGLYLHIPFCSSICAYCNFNRGLGEPDRERRYVAALEKEISVVGDGADVDTVYFGGGTPSLLAPRDVSTLIRACRESFEVDAAAEVSLEVNPETVTTSRVEGWLEAGVTRFSLGVQSFRDEELVRLGRGHTAERAIRAVEEVRAAGGENISLDLMLWLPAQSPDECLQSVETLIELDPDHVSLYLLELYPNAPLHEDMARAGWSMAPDEDAAEMYLQALESLDDAGFVQYEISNAARPARQCRHNLKYWSDGEWLGLGCGAHSTRAGCRWRNISDTERYIDEVAAGRSVVCERRALSDAERIGDMLFTGLRLADGLDLDAIRTRYGVDVMERYGDALLPFFAAGVLGSEGGRLKLSRSGMLVANEVMKTFV